MKTKITQTLLLAGLLISSTLQAQLKATDILLENHSESSKSIEQLIAIKDDLIEIKRYLQSICDSQNKSLVKQTAGALGSLTKEGIYLTGSTIVVAGAAIATHTGETGIIKSLGKAAVASGVSYLILKIAFTNLLPHNNPAKHIKPALNDINDAIRKINYEIEYIDRKIIAYTINS